MAAPTAIGATTIQQIVFIDGSVPNAQMVAADVGPGVVAVVLNPAEDGVRQIATWLASHNAKEFRRRACFCAGTRIGTPSGRTTVEDLTR